MYYRVTKGAAGSATYIAVRGRIDLALRLKVLYQKKVMHASGLL
jgi:hypothetical protein